MAILTALRPLCGDYGDIRDGETFYVGDDAVAESLEARGLAQRFHPKKSGSPEHPAAAAEDGDESEVESPEVKATKPAHNKMMPHPKNKMKKPAEKK